MKKQILSFALVATMIGSIAAGCSSVNETTGSDTTAVDSPSMTAPRDTSSTTPRDTSSTTPSSTPGSTTPSSTPGSTTTPQ
ncbi:hypothetical protein [Mucilaginibacter sp. HD30]